MKKIKIMSAIVLLQFVINQPYSIAQNEIDALRYSQNFPTGSARFTAMGGAFGALGGDFSTLSQNPAGIAIYRKSEITFTPSVFNNSAEAVHYGNSAFGNKSNFNFGNAGIVITFPTGDNSGWVSSNIGFGYNHMNNFNSRVSIDGVNNESSLLDVWKQQIEQNNFDQFGSELAWNAYLIDTTANGKYFTAYPNYKERQTKNMNRTGGLGETVFSFGGNYENKLYLGGSIGFTRIRFTENSTYTETTNLKDTANKLQYFTFNENLTTSGSGINLKLGLIYRATDFFRIGGAIHTPTYYDLNDKWDSQLDAKFTDTSFSFKSEKGRADYALATPFKAIGSCAFIFGKSGLISLDYEFLDYSLARLSGSGTNNYSFSEENKQIGNKYISAGNIKVGTEWKINPFAIRAGFAHYGNPFASGIGNRGIYNSVSAGFGIREENFFIDFGYVLSKMSEKYYLYNPALIQPTDFDFLAQSFLVTFGVRF